MTPTNNSSLDVSVKEFKPLRVAALTYTIQDAKSNVFQGIQAGFQTVQDWVRQRGHDPYLLLTIGIPTLVNGQLTTYECCVQVPESIASDSGTVAIKDLSGGRYAVLSITKDAAIIGATIQRFYDEYVPHYSLKIEAERPTYEIYYENTMEYCVPIHAPARTLQFGRKPQAVLNDPEHIVIRGAHLHNLKHVDVSIPKNKLVVLTGVSGSGKSTLAFDTIYAEAQRRFLESLPSFIRHFMERAERAKVDFITGLTPAISIEQRMISNNPRSTVGTVTGIADYLRLLYSRIGLRRCLACDKTVQPVHTTQAAHYYATLQMNCPHCNTPLPALSSQHFSANSPFGACPACQGLGVQMQVDPALLIRDPRLSILDGALTWLSFENARENPQAGWPIGPIHVIAAHYGVDLELPWQDLPETFRNVIFYGSGDEEIVFPSSGLYGMKARQQPVKGLVPEIARLYRETESEQTRGKYASFMRQYPCPSCGGARLNADARAVTLCGRTITDVNEFTIETALHWVETVCAQLDEQQFAIAEEMLSEIYERLFFLVNVGLHYLTLSRVAPSLSGGEGQRVRLASQLGCGVVGVLYVLDEPSIGLHPRNQRTLLDTLLKLRDLRNSVLVVEHDAETMRTADWLIDMGPGAGVLGGEIIAEGTPDEVMANPQSLTGQYLTGARAVVALNGTHRRTPDKGWLTLYGARLHNLKNLTARFPLGLFTCITGVSGGGKSSLIAQTLEPALTRILHSSQASPSDTADIRIAGFQPALSASKDAGDPKRKSTALVTPGPYDRLEGVEQINKVINITQSPIGRTPRSNPATYTGLFDDIRKLFARTPDAKEQGRNASFFSFNTPGGRCPVCSGHGQIKIEMHFLSDVWITCQECEGTRYTPEALAIHYRGLNIAEVLDLEVEKAVAFFADLPVLARPIKTLHEVGLGYIKLGQSATTLSGGEAQRVKLAKELSRMSTGHTLYILDEPTTGLHFADIQHLLNILHRLAAAGNTVIVIEHNLDVIKTADWIIDLGPEGGAAGGNIVAEGTPEDICAVAESATGQFLRDVLKRV